MNLRYKVDGLHLALANNGGWMLQAYDAANNRTVIVAAYSNDEDLLKALPLFLLEYRKQRETDLLKVLPSFR